MDLEPAIPEHLRQERDKPTSTPSNYEPPFPAYCARFPRCTKEIVMAIIGAQYAPGSQNDGAAISKILSFLTHTSPSSSKINPSMHELASVTDNRGFYNIAVIAYWPSKAIYDTWASASNFAKWWQDLKPEDARHGWFLEVFYPSLDRFETVFSNNEIPEGAAHMRESISGPVKEHVYWGSMRDRLPASQTDTLDGETTCPYSVSDARPSRDVNDEEYFDSASSAPRTHASTASTSRQRVHVPGKKNLTIIRSGQDWSNTLPTERTLYTETMHPILVAGMDFLRDHGPEVGCYSCRFMDIVDPVSYKTDKDRSFGLAYFDELASLENWSKQHKTHLDIFGGFLKYAKTLENNISLRLFHEVLVLTPEQQEFEYVGCHEGTGMLVTMKGE